MMLRFAGSASKPNRRSGDERWKKLSAFDWTIWARFITRRRSAPVGGGSTARISSHAFDEAIRWLTGQMPQMRAMIEGISWIGRPWTIRSKPRNWVTWNWASVTSPASSRWIVILLWPFDPGDRVDDDLTAHALPSPAEAGARGVGRPALEQVDQCAVDEVGRGRTAGQEDVDRDDPMHRPGGRQQRRHHVDRDAADCSVTFST